LDVTVTAEMVGLPVPTTAAAVAAPRRRRPRTVPAFTMPEPDAMVMLSRERERGASLTMNSPGCRPSVRTVMVDLLGSGLKRRFG